MRFYWPIRKLDHAAQMVWGYASTEAEDEQGEIVTRDALAAALEDYMRFANIREMHQPSAVGVAAEAAVDDRGLYLGAHIVDRDAWAKVTAGVYKGFSIGGHVTARDPAGRHIITGLALSEISLVDRPANPEAVFDCWKRAPLEPLDPVGRTKSATTGNGHGAAADRASLVRPKLPADPVGWRKSATAADEPYGDVAYADPGYQADGKKRYPIDTEEHIRAAWSYIHQPGNAAHYTSAQLAHIAARIAAAWHDTIDPAGPPAAQKSAAASLDPPPQAGEGGSLHSNDRVGANARGRLRALLAELCDVLDTVASDDGDTLAAFALADTLRKSCRADDSDMSARLAKLADDILPRLDRLQHRVEDIANTPLPPLTASRGLTAIAKHADGHTALVMPDDIVAALAQMSDEERTLALIKAARSTPIHPHPR